MKSNWHWDFSQGGCVHVYTCTLGSSKIEISDEISKNVVNLMKIEYFWGTFMNFSKKYDFGPIFTKKNFLVFRKKYFNFFNKKIKFFFKLMKIVHFGVFSWIFAKNDIYGPNSTHNPTQHQVRATFKFQHELRAGTEISDEISKNVVNLMKIEYFWGTFMNFSKKYDFGPIFTKKNFLVFRKKYFNFFNKKIKFFFKLMKIVHFGVFSWIFAKNDIYGPNSTHNHKFWNQTDTGTFHRGDVYTCTRVHLEAAKLKLVMKYQKMSSI